MGDRVHLAIMIAALPDNGVGVAGGPDIGGLIERRQRPQQIATLGFGAGNGHQIKHGNLFGLASV